MSLYQSATDREHATRMSDDVVDLHIAWMRGFSPTWPVRRPAAADTISARRLVARMFSQWLPFGLCYASTDQIRAWLQYLEESGKADNTIYIYQYHIEAFYRWACDPRATAVGAILDGNPATGLPRHRRPLGIPHPVTEAELGLLLTAPEPVLTAVILGGWEGLRRGEIVQVRREDVTEERITVRFGKGGKTATVVTHPFTWQHVKDRPSGWLVCGADGDALSRCTLAYLARREFDRLGLPDVTLHGLRHRYGTMIQRTYRDLLVTKRAMRHAQLSTTEIYCQVVDDSLDAAVRGLPIPPPPATAKA